jgi:hypothetical protein
VLLKSALVAVTLLRSAQDILGQNFALQHSFWSAVYFYSDRSMKYFWKCSYSCERSERRAEGPIIFLRGGAAAEAFAAGEFLTRVKMSSVLTL